MNSIYKLLSISIPTWNRAHLIKGLLDELIVQILNDNISSEIEIVVSNNCSEDNTHEVVSELKNKHSFISYNRNPVNTGANANVIKSMELASGDFVLFIGDDDRLEKGSLLRIINFLKANEDAAVIIDSSNFKEPFKEGQISLTELLENYFWNIGNAGVFVAKSTFVKESLNKFGYNFFNDCWSQTQFMLLGLHEHKNFKVYIQDLNIVAHSLHTEVTIYNSFYLWNGAYYQLFRTIKSIEKIIGEENYKAGRAYLKNNILQVVFNILQLGVFIDEKHEREKTLQHLRKNIHQFSAYEKMFLYVMVVALSLPNSVSKLLSDILIFLLKGSSGIKKKNEFVKSEKAKREKARQLNSMEIRVLAFSNEN